MIELIDPFNFQNQYVSMSQVNEAYRGQNSNMFTWNVEYTS